MLFLGGGLVELRICSGGIWSRPASYRAVLDESCVQACVDVGSCKMTCSLLYVVGGLHVHQLVDEFVCSAGCDLYLEFFEILSDLYVAWHR